MVNGKNESLQNLVQGLTEKTLCGLDFMADGSLAERVISLALGEASLPASGIRAEQWRHLAASCRQIDTSGLRIVVLGGGTGLSNIIGGDSRRPEWPENPFAGLKELFPRLHCIVCVTDDGGSTGELLKDFPFIALGDLRHVLLSSVCSTNLAREYGLGRHRSLAVVTILHRIFNYRFISRPGSPEQILADSGGAVADLPESLAAYLRQLVRRLFDDARMQPCLERPQCLGNLLLAAAIYEELSESFDPVRDACDSAALRRATLQGLNRLSAAIGAGKGTVLPATTTSAELQVLYANGVLVTGESKSSSARRGYPVDRVLVEFSEPPYLPDAVAEVIEHADIIIMAPGSLYTSIVPILQVPGIAERIRRNRHALKLLVANIWIQKGETDATRDAPERKFHVSDLIRAYDHNISGGIRDLFSHILTLDLSDVSGSVLQSYAIEQKEPIYLDAIRVRQYGLEPVKAGIFSRELLRQRNVIQHDPDAFALVVRVLWGLRSIDRLSMPSSDSVLPFSRQFAPKIGNRFSRPSTRYRKIRELVGSLVITKRVSGTAERKAVDASERQQLTEKLVEIIWRHPDIRMDHLDFSRGLCLVSTHCWKRCQQWDNVFSFYDPLDRIINIRSDQLDEINRLEMAFLVGVGQSLLGNYAAKKHLDDIVYKGCRVGQIYCLQVEEECCLDSFFTLDELDTYLKISRMYPGPEDRLYSRVVNADEGFTPPGLLFGLLYVWYLDNRFAPNIDYKMSIMKNELSYLIPEQVKIVSRREQLIRFMRDTVFRRQMPQVRLVS
jgi:uncharacterized cofD-like protein